MNSNFNKFFNLKNNYKFGLIGILLFIIFLEIFSKYILGIGSHPLIIKHKSLEYEYVPNQNIKRFHKRIKINSIGMRSDELLESSNKKRILVYGDSIIWGGSFTDQKDLSTEVLKRLLEKNNLYYEIGNISAGGWGPGNWLAHVIERGIYEAEIIILVTNSTDWNDNPRYLPLGIQMPTKNPNFASEELIKRYLVPRIQIAFGSKSSTKSIDLGDKKGLDDLKKFIKIVRQKGAEIVVVQFWDKEELKSRKPKVGHEIIRKVFKENKVKYIDSINKFRKCSKNPDDLYIDYIHPFTKKGQKCLGYVLYEALQLTESFNK